MSKSFIWYVTKKKFFELFPNRANKIAYKDGESDIIEVFPIPKGMIVCDGCNKDLSKEEIIPLYMTDFDMVYGVECESCIEKYFKGVPKVKGGGETRTIKIGEK